MNNLLIFLIQIITNLYLLMLVVRFVMHDYRYYGRGPIIQVIDAATDFCLRPLSKILRTREKLAVVLTILTVVFLRGLLYGFISSPTGNPQVIFERLQLSFLQLIFDGVRVLIVVLFIGTCLGRAGGYYSQPGFRVLEDYTRWYLGKTHKVLVIKQVWVLFGVTLVWIAAIAALLSALVVLRPFLTLLVFLPMVVVLVSLVIRVLTLVMFFYIILNWFSPNPHNLAYQLLQTIARPPIDWARRHFPWARIDMFDLSPMIVFLGLFIAQSLLQQLVSQLTQRLLSTGVIGF